MAKEGQESGSGAGGTGRWTKRRRNWEGDKKKNEWGWEGGERRRERKVERMVSKEKEGEEGGCGGGGRIKWKRRWNTRWSATIRRHKRT